MRHSLVHGRSTPKHAVSEGLMTLAEDKRPEAIRIIGLRPYALQRHQRVIIYVSGVSVRRRLNISDAMPNSHSMMKQLIVKSY
jgi:hypothetical protein